VTTLTLQALGARGQSARYGGVVANPMHIGRSAQRAGLSEYQLGERFRQLPLSEQQRVASRVLDWGVMSAIDEIRRQRPGQVIRGFGDLSQTDQSNVADSVSSLLAPILGSTLSSTTANLSQQAGAVLGPIIGQKLADYGPVFAIIMGLTTATLTLAGMAIFGKYILAKLKS
jgi:hypothetical protein